MGLLSIFQRKPALPSASPADSGGEFQQARTKARQRLIGAVVLIGIGIVAFPLLFESHPRPIPVDIPIAIANKDKVPPLVMPPKPGSAPAEGGEIITESRSEAGREVPPPSPAASATPPPRVERPAAASAVSPASAAKPAVRPAPSASAAAAAAEAARARALLEGQATARAASAAKPAEPTASAPSRFIVQVGAFAEEETARATREKVEKLGLKTYTQVVETASGSRIRVRVGPFASRDEADKAAGKLKAAGLGAALLAL